MERATGFLESQPPNPGLGTLSDRRRDDESFAQCDAIQRDADGRVSRDVAVDHADGLSGVRLSRPTRDRDGGLGEYPHGWAVQATGTIREQIR